MKKTKLYQFLEEQMVCYRDLKNVVVKESGEGFIALPDSGKNVIGRYQENFSDMRKDFPKIIVRKSVAEKLNAVDSMLKEIDPEFQLLVTYGFRSLEVQKKYFEFYKKQFEEKYQDEDQLLEAVHKLIAVPEVAGHPTGGAVDVTILKNGEQLEMGTKLYDFTSKNCYSLSPFIKKSGLINRSVLRYVMLENGFAPFDGEWWHYSFGDKEWAFYYEKKQAIYKQKESSELKNIYEK